MIGRFILPGGTSSRKVLGVMPVVCKLQKRDSNLESDALWVKIKNFWFKHPGYDPLKVGETGEFKSPNFFSGDSARGLSYFEMLGGGKPLLFGLLFINNLTFYFHLYFRKTFRLRFCYTVICNSLWHDIKKPGMCFQ